ncbi:MAG: hypothetical protein WBM72_00165 [Actinomycetota bacterium]
MREGQDVIVGPLASIADDKGGPVVKLRPVHLVVGETESMVQIAHFVDR